MSAILFRVDRKFLRFIYLTNILLAPLLFDVAVVPLVGVMLVQFVEDDCVGLIWVAAAGNHGLVEAQGRRCLAVVKALFFFS